MTVGAHEIYFVAYDAGGTRTSVHVSLNVVSGSPSPTLTPTPTPKPSATPTPTPKPSATPTPTPKPSATPTPTPKPSATPTPKPSATPTRQPSPSAGSGSLPTATPVSGSAVAPAPVHGTGAGTRGTGSTPTNAAGSGTGATASPAPSSGSAAVTTIVDGSGLPADPMAKIHSGDTYTGELPGYQHTQGAYQSSFPFGLAAGPYGVTNPTLSQLVVRLAPTIATVCAGGAAWAAFAFFGKRRRDEAELDETMLATAAASVYEVEAAPGLRVVDESLMPRWRRPSLQQVRRTDPLRAAPVEAPRLSFNSAGARPLADFERRYIGYRLVRLLDSPDEFRSQEIGVLDQGDEVQLLERHGVYWLVLCPDGRQGWVHRMTLAEPERPEVAALEPEPMPQYMDDDIVLELADPADEISADGLLEAYMKARGEVD
jgi:hypothetical protein